MNDILTDLSSEALIRANEQNSYAFSPFSHGWKGTVVSKRPDIDWCVTDLDFHSCNCAFNSHLTAENADEAIEEFIEAGRKRKVGLEWFLGNPSRPDDIAQRLTRHGFTSHGHSAGMAADINEIKEEPLPEGVEIIEVKDRKHLKILARTIAGVSGRRSWKKPPANGSNGIWNAVCR